LKLKIFPTQRAINFEEQKVSKNCILSKSITFTNFKQEVLFLQNNLIDEDSRILYLLQASKFSEFRRLKIEHNFFTFIKNSKHILNFFDELAEGLINIDELYQFSPYRTYHQDLNVLKQLLQNYKFILKKNGKIDKLLAMEEFKLNKYYIKSFDLIELNLNIPLTKFEQKLFKEISKITKTQIHSPQKQNGDECIVVEINSLENRLLQIANIKRKIYEYQQKGIDKKDIVIITPDNQFHKKMRLFDYQNDFDFVDGISFQESKIYQELEAIESFLEKKNQENNFRVKRLNLVIEVIYDFIFKHNFEDVIKFLNEYSNLAEKEIVENELKKFKTILGISNDFRKLFHLFIKRLSSKKFLPKKDKDDKILVMDILQTQNIEFKAVIIIDFNEEIIPKKVEKGLFLSSDLKKSLDMITKNDEQNWEKKLYRDLIKRAKFVSISYVKNSLLDKSRFLEELNLANPTIIDEEKLLSILYQKNHSKDYFSQEDLELEYDFGEESLSATKLKLFLECKRRFYLRYIRKIKNFEIPKEKILDNREVGIKLHEALKLLYRRKNYYHNAKELLRDLEKIFIDLSCDNLSLKYQLDSLRKNFEIFAQKEVKRFMQGYEVQSVEQYFTQTYNGFKLHGFIDRIDVKDDKITIIDYKSGKIPTFNPKKADEHSDFQLEIYYRLLEKNSNIEDISYYDLHNQTLIKWQNPDEKLQLFDQKLELLKEKKINFTKTDDTKHCLYCEYKIICNRV